MTHLSNLRFAVFNNDDEPDLVCAFASHIAAADWCDGGSKGDMYLILDLLCPNKLRYSYYATEADMENYSAWVKNRA